MRIKRSLLPFLCGALLGDLLASLFLIYYWLIPVDYANAMLGQVLLAICPFWVLGFANISIGGGWATLIAIAFIGNAILYGLVVMLCFWLYKFTRNERMKMKGN